MVRVAALGVAVARLALSDASAGGYYYSDSGIVATGRGGAWIAGADTQFAQRYNPAGLIRVDAPTVNIGWSAVQQDVSFLRLRPEGDPSPDPYYPIVHNAARPFSVPELGFAAPLGDRFAVALGFISPFAPSSLYPEEGPQRYTVKDTGIYQFGVGPSLAWRVHPAITIGAGLQASYLQLEQTVDITLDGTDDPKKDIAVEARVRDPFTLTGNVGLLIEPSARWCVGASFTPGSRYVATGSGTLDFRGNTLETFLDPAVYTDDAVSLAIALPHELRVGVLVRPDPAVEVEAAVVWQGWSALSDIEITDIDIEVQSDSPFIPADQRTVDDRIVLPAGLRDTVSLRLGAEWQADELLALRVGGFRESGALPDTSMSVALVDPWKWQVGGGASAWTTDRRVRLDLAAAALFFPDLSIRGSGVTQIDAGVLPDVEPTVVGDGEITASGWIAGVSASLRLGRERAPARIPPAPWPNPSPP